MIVNFTKALLTSFFVFVACEAELTGTSFAADPSSPPPATVAYEHVASHLDPNGSIYLYWDTENLLGEIDGRLQSVKEAALLDARLTEAKKAQFESGFELARQVLLDSGVKALKAFGMSSRPVETGLYLSRSFLYAPDRSGYLWSSFAKPPHEFGFLKLIPENTEAFGFIDFDLANFWDGISKDLAAAGIPEITSALQQLPAQTEAVAGMSLDDLLGSLGDQIGFIVTLDPVKTAAIPFGAAAAVIPEPAVALFLKLNNDKIFDRVDALFSANQEVEKTDELDLKLRVLKGKEPVTYLTPALARYGDYMILSSSDTLIRAVVDANSGKSEGIRTSAEFNALSAGMPDKGNSAAYVSRRFQSTVAVIQQKYNEAQPAVDEGTRKLIKSLSAISSEIASYKVGGTTDDGWVSTAKTTKDLNDILGELLVLPIQAIAEGAIAELKRGGTTSGPQPQRTSPPEPPSPAAGTQGNGAQSVPAAPNPALGTPAQVTQKVSPVSQSPFAIAPVAIGRIPSGSKIEP